MAFLTGLHGIVALVLFSSLLFAEEAGVPLPFAPGEAVLIAAGILIADGALVAWVFIPAACLATAGGSVAGYLWARALGPQALYTIAERLRATGSLKRVEARVRSTGSLGIAISRLIPGFRIYTTLVAGAFRFDLETFIRGMVPAAVVWVLVFTILGGLVGLPMEHFLGQVGKLLLDGVILVAVAVTAALALWHVQRARLPANDLHLAPTFERILIALAIDGGIVACLVAGFASLVRAGLGVGGKDDLVDAFLVVATTALAYMILSRRSLGGTGGETIVNIRYRAGKSDSAP